ncbi:MAG TPA: sulfatase-like hydrolase/transferase [Anaerolineaceae bacterium]|nr:sulfatase-like hydrolase/transferase [Anaerolineaceae bacterium]
MTPSLSRRDVLKLLAALPAAGLLRGRMNPLDWLAGGQKPNLLVVVYDTLAAEHLTTDGYPRDTTPHLANFARQATVFHRHYTSGNFTTPGTASLLTGAYPWSHRAFNIAAPVAPAYARRSIFSALGGAGYHRLAYTHNLLADTFLHQFAADLEQHLPPETYFLAGTPGLDRLFRGDPDTAYRSTHFLSRILPSERVMPASLFLSLLNELGLEQYEATLTPELAALFPDGLPEEDSSKSFFLLEDAIDGMMELLAAAPQPFLGYFHLYPPHHPYHPPREFIGRFDDGWAPEGKPEHFFTAGQADADLAERRRKYDEFLAYADYEFGRLAAFLESSGLLETTWVVFTSDHGEMFERGIKGHNTPVLYNPLVRVPLLVHQPGQAARTDVYTPTSCVDLLPTLALAAGQPIPAWSEGQPLPLFGREPAPAERPIFALDARRNSKFRPLETGTVAMIKGQEKFIAYYGYPGFDRQFELYDLENDLEERQDLSRADTRTTDRLKNELEITLQTVNLPFRA